MGKKAPKYKNIWNRHRKRQALVRDYGERCLRCGSLKELTLDHIVPQSAGGSGALTNLQLLCTICNRRKGANEVDYRPRRTG